ncbi:MAG TPA: polysaccharide deacetylase family protein [Spirochaetota bacterium]
MKRYTVLIIPLLIAPLLIVAVFFIARPGETAYTVSPDMQNLKVKEKETITRLLEVPIILYHNIDGKGAFSITEKKLREQFDYFRAQGITVVPLADLLDRLDNPRPYDHRVIVITFDDGYKNMYKKLLPVVKEYRYPVTLFVYTDFVNDRESHAIHWDELREMQQNGIDIQCHTKSHPDLPKLIAEDTPQSREQLYKEIYLSRVLLESKLGKPVDLLAFPFGRYDIRTIQISTFAGYRRVFSTDYGSNIVTHNNYCLRRHHIKRDYTISTLEKIIR